MRLIDADEFKKCFSPTLHGREVYNAEEILMTIQTVPTIDAEPVVRCKDCKYKQGSVCDYSAIYIHPNGYCNWGEMDEVEE